MGVHVSFQLSALLQPDPAFPLLENVNRTKLVPLFWATEGFSTPTPWMVSTTNLALSLPSLGAQVDQQAHWHHENQHHHLQGISIGLLLLGGVLTLITLAMGALARWGLFLPRTSGCDLFQKIHKYGINEIMQMYPGGEANQERFWSHSNCLLPFVLPNFLLCHVQNID